MKNINKRIFEEYFYYGIDNVAELLEGIVYFSTREMHQLYPSLEEQYKTPNDIQLSQIKEVAYKYGIQYYRFIEINKTPNKLIDYKTKYEMQKVKQEINSTLEGAINKNSLIEYNIGYYYSAADDYKFSSTYYKDYQIRKYWTTEVVEQLKQLSIQEKENPIEYYRNWVNVRLKTAESRIHKNDSEIKLMQSVKKQLDERINQSQKCKEKYEMIK